jgi:nitrous oxide reductase accessory protein NosL
VIVGLLFAALAVIATAIVAACTRTRHTPTPRPINETECEIFDLEIEHSDPRLVGLLEDETSP